MRREGTTMIATTEATDLDRYRRFAGVCALLSCPFAWADLTLGMAAIGFRFDVIDKPLLRLELSDPRLRQLGWVCDVLGFYLLLVPAALALRAWLRPRRPLMVDLITLCGLGYAFVGATGAAFLAGAEFWMVRTHQTADPAARQVLGVLFNALQEGVNGIWQFASMLLGALFLLGMGLLLRRERALGGWLAVAAGFSALLVPLGGILDVPALGALPLGFGLVLFFLLEPLWALWLGVSLFRGKIPPPSPEA